MADFIMPVLGADMKAGELVSWLKQPGDAVQRGEVIAEVETDKAVIEIESMFTGTVENLLLQPGDKVPVGTVMATIQVEGEGPIVAPSAVPPTAESPQRVGRRRETGVPSAAGGRLRISPVAQQLAAEKGVDLSAITGSGPGGRIMERDVEEALTARVPQPPRPPPADRATRMRQSIAAAMSRSHGEIPHFHVQSVIDMSRAIEWLTVENSRRPVAKRMIYGVLLVKAAAVALRKVPELNAVWAEDHVEPKPSIHVGVAISLPGGGLISPAIHDTDLLSLADLMTQFRDLVQRARSGHLRASEISDPTVTVTSLGEQGAETVLGLINPPQVALVGFGRLTERPWVVEGRIEPRKVIHVTLAGDHRAVDGYRGSIYLAELERLLQEPEEL